MYFSFLCKLYIHLISVLTVFGHEFSQQNPYNRRIPPNSEAIHKQQNAMFSGRAHSRPKTIGFESAVQKSLENRSPLRETTAHPREQMPYQSNDRHMRTTNSRQQLIPVHTQGRQHNTVRSTQQMQIHLPPKYQQNSFTPKSTRHPEIVDNSRNFRIQSPINSEEEFNGLQNIDNSELQNNFKNNNNNNNNNKNNNFRQFRNSIRDMNPRNMGLSYNRNEDPIQQMSRTHRPRNIEEENPQQIFRNTNVRPNPSALGMKMVLPKNQEESRVQGFESFASNINHVENDKTYPKFEQRFVQNIRQFPTHPPIAEPPEEQREEPSEDYPNAPENEAEYQRHLNLFPPTPEEEVRKFSPQNPQNKEMIEKQIKQQQQQNLQQIPKYFRNHFKQSDPMQYYSKQNQQNQNQNEGNHQNIQNYPQHNTQHHMSEDQPNAPFESISVGPILNTFHGERDPNPNEFQSQRNHINKQTNRFEPFNGNNGNDLQRQTNTKPTQRPIITGRPLTKEIHIIREITEISPSDDEHADDRHFDPSPIVTPSPPDPPKVFELPYDLKETIKEDFKDDDDKKEREDKQKKIDKKNSDLGKEDNFYDEEDDEFKITTTTEKPKDMDRDEEESDKRDKSKFEKEVDLSADELEKYFDIEFAGENEKDEEAQKKLVFDDEAKESELKVSKKEKDDDDKDDADPEADYKTSTDFLKNHDDFLSKIEKENERFRKRTEDKVTEEKEEDESEKDNETEQTKTEKDEAEKELDGESEKKDTEEETEDNKLSDQKTNKEENSNEEEENKDSNEESKDKTTTETEGEDEDESESKEVTEKEGKSDDKNEENQKNEDKKESEEQEEETEEEEETDKQKSDNTESSETNKSNEAKEEKNDKCAESNCDKELLKEEESKKSEELKANEEEEEEETEEEVEQQTTTTTTTTTSTTTTTTTEPSTVGTEKTVEIKPMENKVNRTLRISQTHNFAPFFIDLKRIKPNNSNIRNGVKHNDSQTGWTTSATTNRPNSPNSSLAKRINSAQGVSPVPDSMLAFNDKRANNITIGTRHVVNSIKDIIRAQRMR